jgi:hypothetical protein
MSNTQGKYNLSWLILSLLPVNFRCFCQFPHICKHCTDMSPPDCTSVRYTHKNVGTIGRKFRLPGTGRASRGIQGGTASVGGVLERRALALTFLLPGEDRRTIDLNIQPNQVSRARICKRFSSLRIDSASLFFQRWYF